MAIADSLFNDSTDTAVDAKARQDQFIFDSSFDFGATKGTPDTGSAAPLTTINSNFSFNLPSLDLGNSNDQSKTEDQKKTIASEAASSPDGFGLSIPALDFSGVKLPQLDFSGVKLASPIPSIHISDPIIPDLSSYVPDLSKPLALAGDVAKTVTDPLFGAVSNTAGFLGENVVRPITDFIGSLDPFHQEVTDHADKLAGELNLPSTDFFNDVGVKQGYSGGYGQIKVGDTGLSLDVSKKMDTAISGVLVGTQLEGVAPSDIFALVTDPGKFVEHKGEEYAAQTMSQVTGVDLGGATKIVGGIAEAIATGDVGKAAENVAKSVVSNAVVSNIANLANLIVPGAGVVLNVLATIFHYSCYLSTASYANGYIDKQTYLDFTRYRLRVQSAEPLGTAVWLGYVVTFRPIFNWLITSPKRTGLMTKHVLMPWHSHIKHLLGEGEWSWHGYAVTQALRFVCLLGLVVHPWEAYKTWRNMGRINIMQVYRDVISEVEGKKRA